MYAARVRSRTIFASIGKITIVVLFGRSSSGSSSVRAGSRSSCVTTKVQFTPSSVHSTLLEMIYTKMIAYYIWILLGF